MEENLNDYLLRKFWRRQVCCSCTGALWDKSVFLLFYLILFIAGVSGESRKIFKMFPYGHSLLLSVFVEKAGKFLSGNFTLVDIKTAKTAG